MNPAPAKKKGFSLSRLREFFAKASGSSPAEFHDGNYGYLICNNSREWRKNFPHSQETAYKILTRDLETPARVDVMFGCCGQGEIKIEGPDYEDWCELRLLEKIASPSGVCVSKRLWGNGAGRTLMRNEIEFFHASRRVRALQITAGDEGGGYAWARFGFLPTGDMNKFGMVHAVCVRLEQAKPLLGEAELKEISRLVELQKPEDVWRLADCRIDLGTRLLEVRGTKRSQGLRDAFLFSSSSLCDIYALAEKGSAVPAGRYFLAGTKWKGEFVFDNDDQLKRAADYVGGWAYIPGG